MIDCEHASAALPDPLPEPIAAARRLRLDPARGVDVRRIMDRIRWAVRVADLTGVGGARMEWTHSHACAVLRRHPSVAELRTASTPALCRITETRFRDLPDRTELGLAERIAVLCGADLAWSPDGAFRVWEDGTLWRTDQSHALAIEQAKVVVRDLLVSEAADAQGFADRLTALDDTDGKGVEVRAAVAAAKKARAFAAHAQSAKTMRAALELVRGEAGVYVPDEGWDADDRLLTVQGHTLELGDGGVKAREHRREDRITRTARAAYRPRADRTDWDRFLAHVLPDPEVRTYAQRLFGYSLMGGNPARILLVLIGPTSTGKSTLLEAIAHALGDYASTFKLTLFRGDREGGAPRPDLHAALPRRLIVTTEASDRWDLHADQVKRLTGGDTEHARTVYKGTYREQRPAFLPVIATNSAPRMRGADAALWRRLVAIPFAVTIGHDVEDARLGERLREQADAVLAWLTEGFDAYARDGLGVPPQACLDAVTALRRDMTLVDRWLADQTEDGAEHEVPMTDLADDWHGWCLANRVEDKADKISAIKLGIELTARGYGTAKAGPSQSRYRVRTGLRLRPDREAQTGAEGTEHGPAPVRPLRAVRR